MTRIPLPAPPKTPDMLALTTQIRRCGVRATPARIRVLQILQKTIGALTHHEVESALGAAMPDRVTLYRVLLGLVDVGLAHKSTDARGVFRFTAAATGKHAVHATHAHFNCEDCGRVFCLAAPPPKPPELPEGFSLSRMEIDLRGRCASCEELLS